MRFQLLLEGQAEPITMQADTVEPMADRFRVFRYVPYSPSSAGKCDSRRVLVADLPEDMVTGRWFEDAQQEPQQRATPVLIRGVNPPPPARQWEKVKPLPSRQSPEGDKPHVVPYDFEDFKREYPKRLGSQRWPEALRHANARIREGYTFDQMVEGARRYHRFMAHDGRVGSQFVLQAATFLGKNLHFMEEWAITGEPRRPRESTGEQLKRIEGEGVA